MSETGPEQEPPKNLHQRMLAITGDCKKAKEDGKVRGSKISYDFTSHNAVTELIQPLLVLHGVDASPALTNLARDTFEVYNYEKPRIHKNRLTVYFDMRFVNVDDPKDVEIMPWFAEAVGNDDKQVGIAVSAGIRQAYQKRFKLRSGDPDIEDKDNDNKDAGRNNPEIKKKHGSRKHGPIKDKKGKASPVADQVDDDPRISPGLNSMFNALAKKYDWISLEISEQVLSYFGVDTPEELLVSQWDAVKVMLEKGPVPRDIPF